MHKHLTCECGHMTHADSDEEMVRKALPRLSARAEIETVDGKHAVVDPLFAEWIERINRGVPEDGEEAGA